MAPVAALRRAPLTPNRVSSAGRSSCSSRPQADLLHADAAGADQPQRVDIDRLHIGRSGGRRGRAAGDQLRRDPLRFLLHGRRAMVQGRVEEAGRRYGRARRGARKFFSSDPCLTVSTDALLIELDLERNREKAIQPRTLKNLTELRGVWVDVYSTAVAVSAELMLGQYDSQAVIKLLSKAVDDAPAAGIESLSKHMPALLAYYLVEVGRPDEAGQVWRDHGLPCDESELLDLECRSWRTMEALSCARVRLLAEGRGECGAAEALASGLCSVASEHGLTRTLLRGLALSMDVAHRAGQPDRALERLVDFLRTVRGTGYSRPLVRHRTVSRIVLRRLLATDLDEELRAMAESMQATVGGSATGGEQIFSTRELEVLAEAARGLRSKEIAGRLGISDVCGARR